MLRADHAQNESHQKNTESGQPIYASVKIVFLAPSNKTAKRFYFGIVNLKFFKYFRSNLLWTV